MMSKLRTLVLSFVIVLYSGWVSALGLGELRLNSSLNEPFDAEVALLNPGDLNPEQLFVRLASKEEFEQTGTARELYLLDLRFKLDVSTPDKPVIRVTSTRPMREPYLDFLIQLEWPSGRLLREYTIFLDLPVFASKQPSRTSGARASQVNSVADSSSEAKKKVSSSVNTPSPVARRSDGASASHRVKSGDTLWGIARENGSQDSSIQQVMQAIFERNDRAFINGDMNRLKKGALLDIPEASAISAVDDRLAKNQVALSVQDRQGQIASQDLVSSEAAQVDTSESSTQGDGVLRLLSPSEGSGSGSLQGQSESLSGDLIGEVLENDLAIAQEGLSKSNRENAELKEKVARLEEQLSTMARLVELGDDQLSAIQQGLGADDSAALTEELGQVEPAFEQTVDPDSPAQDSPVQDSGVEQDDNVQATLETEPQQVDSVDTEAQPQSLLAGLRDKLTLIAGGLLLVVLGVLFLLSRRGKDEEEDAGSFDSADKPFSFDDREPLHGTESADVEPLISTNERVDDDQGDSQLSGAVVDDAIFEDDAESEEGAGGLGEVDPIGEADIYLSFGDYAQAEDVIRSALVRNPNDSRLHLKLLDLFSIQGDQIRFDDHYPALVVLGDSNAILSADRMRESLDVAGDGELELSPEIDEDAEQPVFDDTSDSFTGDTELALDLESIEPIEEGAEAVDSESDLLPHDAELEEQEDSDLDDESELYGDLPDLHAIDNDVVEESQDTDLDDFSLDTPVAEESGDLELVLDLSETDETDLVVDTDASMDFDGLDLGDMELDLGDNETTEGEQSSSEFDDFDVDADLDSLVDGDEVSTQLELAQAYIDMGDVEGARSMLNDVIDGGDQTQQAQAQEILKQIA